MAWDRIIPVKMPLRVVVFLFGLPLLAAAMPLPTVWRNVTVGGGGFAPNIVFSRVEPGLAYLRTDMGGAYRWDAPAARWRPLQDGQAEPSYLGVESIAPDPADPALVYMATGVGRSQPAAIQRSADRGRTWRITPVPFRMGGNEDGRGMGERLAVDPNRTTTLLFGSRHDGLWRSDDSGSHWAKVAGFVDGLGLPPRGAPTHGGISFVVFDPARPRLVYAGLADPGARHLFRSDDGGTTWKPIAGGPGAEMLPAKAEVDGQGRLFVAYVTGLGPNGIAGGAVWRLAPASGTWTDITPDPGGEGGYMGLSLDRRRPGRIAVSSVDHWHPGDTVWLSTDAGEHWDNLRDRSRRDTHISPFLNFGAATADFGHWTAGLAIDPFDHGHLAYTTGATVYDTRDGARPGPMTWTPWVRGIEQTAVITLVSPTGGAPLVSGFGDIAGFVHDRLDQSPPHMHLDPALQNTNNLDYAGLKPAISVRSGTQRNADPATVATLAWSDDGGHDWHPLRVPPLSVGSQPARRYDTDGDAAIAVSADGRTFLVATPVVQRTIDHGLHWSTPVGLPQGARAIADKVDPTRFYAVAGNHLLVSHDGGASFVATPARGLPADLTPTARHDREGQWPLVATPGIAGDLWFAVAGTLWHSRDGAASFTRASGMDIAVDLFGLGKAAPGRPEPAVYTVGRKGGRQAVWRSDDAGRTWLRINDDDHQWGLRFRAIAGDPRRYGRVYLATDGRGIVYGDIAQPGGDEPPRP